MSIALAIAYSGLSVAYFSFADSTSYAKNLFNCGIAIPMPLFYAALTVTYISLYAYLTKQGSALAYPAVAMAALLPLFYLLIEMKIGIGAHDPFRGARGIYGLYASAYFFIVISSAAAACGLAYRRLIKTGIDGAIFHLPLLIFLIYCSLRLVSYGHTNFALFAAAAFLVCFSFEAPAVILKDAVKLIAGLVKNEKFLLVLLFAAALLIRYYWGMRLLGLTGARYVAASDDGPAYDIFAATISGGGVFEKGTVYVMSGFGYWYALAAIYKIFGLHNYAAVITVQSFIGAFVPVFTYIIAKKVFDSNIVAAVAGVITAVDMTLVFLSTVIGMEALYIPLVLMALAISADLLCRKAPGTGKPFLAGCAIGLAYNTRPPELLFFPALLATIMLIAMKGKTEGRNIVSAVTALFAGFLILASVQYVSNYAVYGEKPRLQGAAAASFHADGVGGDENKLLGEMGFSPFEDARGSLKVFVGRPYTVSRLIVTGFLKRLVLLYMMPNFGVFDPVYLVNPASGYFFGYAAYMQLYGYILTALGVLAALRLRHNRAAAIALIMFVCYISFRIALFYVLNSRYRGVLIPVFAIFFAYGLNLFCRNVRDAYRKGALAHAG